MRACVACVCVRACVKWNANAYNRDTLPLLLQVTADAQSNWLMGVQLVAVYILVGLVFFFRNDD